MVKSNLIILILVVFFSCKKSEPQPVVNTVEPIVNVINTGNVNFHYPYTPPNNIGTGVQIFINGIYKGKITSISSVNNGCGTPFGFNYSDSVGTYNYEAKVIDANPNTYNFNKSGSFTIVSNGCTKVNITQ